MRTHHQVVFDDARSRRDIPGESVELIVTSPPYPLVEMWDATFAAMSAAIGRALEAGQAATAFDLMHQELDKVWRECARVLKPGGVMCINIGDAVRTIAGQFQMHSNHARITHALGGFGLMQLPDILWRKPTNAPNKFMGSGMLPAGAYVTYEHEYILIFRKGERRLFKTPEEKQNRRASAFFWEERNRWFSDLWADLKGTGQGLIDQTTRQRSAAYPMELAYRLINMHSVYGDTVLDPFLGTGTTTAAAIATGRNSIGVELDTGLQETIKQVVHGALKLGPSRIATRFCEHQEFVCVRTGTGLNFRHHHHFYGFPVITAQETDIAFYAPYGLDELSIDNYKVKHEITSPGLAAASAAQNSLPNLMS